MQRRILRTGRRIWAVPLCFELPASLVMPNSLTNPKTVDPSKTVSAEDVIASAHDLAATEATVKEILKDGTPDWVRFPKEYRSMAAEDLAQQKERTAEQVDRYKFEDQDLMTDEESRLVNFIDANRFLHKLRALGVVCKVFDGGKRGTMGLYAMIPGKERLGFQFIASIQVPVMPEWSLLAEDQMGLPNGEAAIGWRQPLFMLVKKRVITEDEMYREFGKPIATPFTARHRRALQELRSGIIGADDV